MQLVTTIRYASPHDAALLAELGRQTFYDTFAAQNTAENMTAYLASAFGLDKQAAELADPLALFLIAEIDGDTAGYVKLHVGDVPPEVTGPNPIELVRIYTVKDWIGHGVGPALMQAAISEAQKRAYQTLWLGVWEHNPRAMAFYRKWGFEKIGSHVFLLGDDPQNDYLMQRSI
jgi:diamine N-acetyltransferase